MLRIDDDQRRARLGARHLLAADARAGDPAAVAAGLVGLHGSDPASVFLSAVARLAEPAGAVAAVERALYDEHRLVRTLGMRRTMFVVPVDLVPVVQAACTDPLVPGERRRLVQQLEAADVTDDGAGWLAALETATMAELEARGAATGAELARAVPGLATQLAYGEGRSWAGTMGLSTRVLFLLSTEQRVARGRPRGSWTSSQYRWSPMAGWLPAGAAAMGADEARAELARRWLERFGPGSTADLKWWTGWTVANTKAALDAAGAVKVGLGTGPGWCLPGDEEPVPVSRPWVALLPGLDPTTMGWRERGWYLGGLGPALFDTNGNAGPTVWADGRVVGGWAQRRTGEVVHRLLEDIGAEAEAAVADAAGALGAWLGETRVTPRFPTPLQKELSAGAGPRARRRPPRRSRPASPA